MHVAPWPSVSVYVAAFIHKAKPLSSVRVSPWPWVFAEPATWLAKFRKTAFALRLVVKKKISWQMI
jgi:hypothetical protein